MTPATRDRATAQDWFTRFEGAGLDGVIAKAVAGPYTSDKRTMLKIKHERDCDCVSEVSAGTRMVMGPRSVRCCWASTTTQANCSMLESASFTAAKRKELVKLLAPYREEALRDHPWADWADDAAQANGRMPGGQSRWNSGKDLSWQPLRIELVVEVAYEHMQGDPLSPLRAFPAVAP